MAVDAEGYLCCRLGDLVGDDGGIGNGLDQAGTKGGGGDADGDVVSGEFEVPVGLLDIAAGGAVATGAIEMVEAGAAP